MKYTFLLLAISAWGQQLDLSSLDKLGTKASESSTVNLDSEKLKIAAGFLSGSREKEIASKLAGLKAVFVRSFEFDKSGMYSQTDLEPIRKQLQGPGWAKAIDVKEKDETAEIYFYKAAGNGGMAIIASEGKELTVVNLVGELDLASLGGLVGTLGIPNIQSGFTGGGKQPPSTPQPAKRKTQDDDDEEN